MEYRKRTSAGWQAVEHVTDSAMTQYSMSLAIDSQDNVHVVWDGLGWGANPASDNVEYRKRTSAGWQPQESVTDFNAPNVFPAPTVAIDSSDIVHVAWTGVNAATSGSNTNVEYRKRTSAGWQAVESVTNATNQQEMVSMAIDSSNNVHLVWNGAGLVGTSASLKNIFYAQRTSGGWLGVQALTNQNSTDQFPPSIALDAGNNVHVVWEGAGLGNTTYNQDNIQYIERIGGVWQPIAALTNRPDVQSYPSFIWAMDPTIGGAKPNRTKTGYAMIWAATNGTNPPQVRYYASPNLSWDGATSTPCDVNLDGSTNVVDVQMEVNQALGATTCTADINKDNLCNVIDVQRVTNAALGGQCVSP